MLEIVVRSSSSPSGSTLKPSVSKSVVSEVDIVDDAGRTKGKLKTIKTVVVKQKRVLQSTSKEQHISTSTDAVTVKSSSTNAATLSSATTNANGVTNVTSFSSNSSETSKSVAHLVTENVVQQSQESATPSDSCPSTEAFEDSLENANVHKDTTESIQCLVRDKQGNIVTVDGGPDQIPADCTLVQVVKVKKVTATKMVKTSSTVTHNSKTMLISSSQSAAASTSAAITDSLSPRSDDAQDTSASISLSMDSMAGSVEELSSVSSNVAQFEGASTHSLFSNRSPSHMSKTRVDAYIHQCRGMCAH